MMTGFAGIFTFAVKYPGFAAPPSICARSPSIRLLSHTVPCPPLRLKQLWNILYVWTSAGIFHFSDTFMVVSEEQLKNIQSKSLTLVVSKSERSTDVREEQFAKIVDIIMTCEVSKPERSTDLRDSQSSNISYIYSTREVSKPERSTDVRRLQPSNILAISSSHGVLKDDRSIEVRDSQS